MKALNTVPLIALCFVLLQLPCSWSQAFAESDDLSYRGLTRATILSALKGNRSVCLQQGVDVKFVDASLVIALWQPHISVFSQKGDDELKEQSLSLAKTISRHFPGVFDDVQCSFFDSKAPDLSRTYCIQSAWLRANNGIASTASAGKQDKKILAAMRAVSEHEPTLAELYGNLSYRQILDKSPFDGAELVFPGASNASNSTGLYAAERKELSDQLTTLRANGYDVSQATGQLCAFEDLVRTRHYDQLPQAFARTRQSLAETVSSTNNLSVASSRTKSWQR